MLLIPALFGSCVGAIPVTQRNEPPPRDPRVNGRSELLSEAELHAMLLVARARLASLRPTPAIFEVQVTSANKVEAYYGEDRGLLGPTPYLALEHFTTGWRVTGMGKKNKPVKAPPNVIVT